MEQIVTVRALYPDGTAEVACRRASACGGDCGHCGGCTNAQTVLVRAYNPIGAKPGDRVVVESASCQVLGAAAAVYLLPVLFLLGGYALAGGPGGAIGFALGLAPAVWMDRRRRKGGRLLYTVSSFAGGSSGVSENS
ncbi:MAG: SoxR reducing system RseC family protein [Oscillospiraceae bacterium]